MRPLRPLPPPPSDAPGAMGRVVAQSVVMFSVPAAALGALGAMGAILRVLSGRADIFKCGLPPLLLWRVISISKCSTSSRVPSVQSCGWCIALIGPDDNDVSAARRRNFLKFFKFLDQRRCDAFASMRCRHGQIVDIDFAALLLELVKFVGDEAADDRAAVQRGKRHEIFAGEQTFEIARARSCPAIDFHLAECFAKRRHHCFHQRHVAGR